MIYLSCHARICAFNITGLFMVHWYELHCTLLCSRAGSALRPPRQVHATWCIYRSADGLQAPLYGCKPTQSSRAAPCPGGCQASAQAATQLRHMRGTPALPAAMQPAQLQLAHCVLFCVTS